MRNPGTCIKVKVFTCRSHEVLNVTEEISDVDYCNTHCCKHVSLLPNTN